MQAIRRFLLEPYLPLWRYCLLAFPLALIPSVAIYGAAESIARALGADLSRLRPPDHEVTLFSAFGIIVFAPAVETLLLAGGLSILQKFFSLRVHAAVASAVAWGIVHGLQGPLWFFGVVWSFFVFSCAFQAWRKWGFGRAYLAAAVPHALINLTAFAMTSLSQAHS